MANMINWFEIPVSDFERAKKFYETIFGIQLHEQVMGPLRMGFFPFEMDKPGVSGAICLGEGYVPTDHGVVIYLNADRIIDEVIGRISGAGGNVILPKQLVTEEIGHISLFIDSEGNKVGLHAPPRA